jgi:carboxylesterase
LNRTRWQDWVAASEKVYQQLARHCQKVILAGESAGAVIVLYLVVQGRHDTTIHPTAGEMVMKYAGSTVKEMHWMERSTHVVLLDQELDEITQFSVDFINRALALKVA